MHPDIVDVAERILDRLEFDNNLSRRRAGFLDGKALAKNSAA
jgi:hypothetical protein